MILISSSYAQALALSLKDLLERCSGALSESKFGFKLLVKPRKTKEEKLSLLWLATESDCIAVSEHFLLVRSSLEPLFSLFQTLKSRPLESQLNRLPELHRRFCLEDTLSPAQERVYELHTMNQTKSLLDTIDQNCLFAR